MSASSRAQGSITEHGSEEIGQSMTANPFLGVFFHSIGGLAAASFYLPYGKVRKWSWETYWLVGGFCSWVIVPWVMACFLVPEVMSVLRQSPAESVMWSYVFGLMWGVGGLTFGLSMRYLGMSLGYAVALGLCAAFGTLMPPIFKGTMGEIVSKPAGWAVLFGVAVCLAGIAVSGLAGIHKEGELSEQEKKSVIKEFSFIKGVIVAIFAGVMSACMSFGVEAGAGIAKKAVELGTPDLWQNLPVWIVVFAGGFTTNLVWCVALNIKNGSFGNYIGVATAAGNPGGTTQVAAVEEGPPLVLNYVLSALAGTMWYFQFFFFGMGKPLMGKKYDFSSWSLHMASIIIFSTLWGIWLREWGGVSRRTMKLVWAGVGVLVVSMIIIGIGNSYAAK